jgi:hypothetical protein
MAFKAKTKEFKSEAGNKYTFQSVLPSVWARVVDRITDKHGKLLNQHAMPAMLENVVVEPAGLKMDDFEDWAELEEVTTAAFRFQQHGE